MNSRLRYTLITALGLLGLLAMCLAPPVQAQTGPTTFTYTNAIAATQTVVMTSQPIDTSRLSSVLVLLSATTTAGTNGTVGFAFQGSVDNSTWTTEASADLGFTLTLDGTNTVRSFKAIDTTYWRWIRLWKVTNSVETAVTNVTLQYFSKTKT